MSRFSVYILQCSDNSYYTGVTSSLERRLFEHMNGLVEGYTSKRTPVKLVFYQHFSDILEAIQVEKQIKG